MAILIANGMIYSDSESELGTRDFLPFTAHFTARADLLSVNACNDHGFALRKAMFGELVHNGVSIGHVRGERRLPIVAARKMFSDRKKKTSE